MSHDTQLYSMMDTKWGVHGSIQTGWVGKLFGLHVSADGGYDSHSLKTNFTRTGKVSFDSQRKQFKYNEKILVKARSKSKVTMNTQPIAGSQSFKAHYRIRTTRSNGNLTLSHVKNSLRRQGFSEWNSLTQDKSGDIIFTVLGHMDVDAGVDTHILIESSPLKNTSVSVNSTRRISLNSPPPPPILPVDLWAGYLVREGMLGLERKRVSSWQGCMESWSNVSSQPTMNNSKRQVNSELESVCMNVKTDESFDAPFCFIFKRIVEYHSSFSSTSRHWAS